MPIMAQRTQKPAHFVVLIKKTWVDTAGVGDLIMPSNARPAQGAIDFHAVLATSCTFADSFFLEIEFYPAVLKGKIIKLFVPKHEVLAVLQTEAPGDLAGFKSTQLS